MKETNETLNRYVNTEALNKYIQVLKYNYTIDDNDISDGHHTFRELYDYRMLYNALFINQCAKDGKIEVYKSKKHDDGFECFGGGWFIVVAVLPTGIVDNHYKLEYWDLFECEEAEIDRQKYDGHTPQDVANRMFKYLQGDY